MKLRIAVLLTVAVTFVSVSQGEASAAGRRIRNSLAPALGPVPTTILPSSAEIMAVPSPGQGRLVGYGLNMYPSARLVRMVFGR